MSVIPIHNNKSIETKELEVHVVMCEYRRKVMEDKIENIEKQLEDINTRAMMSKKLILGSIFSVITGVITTIFSILLNYNFLKS